MSGDPSVIGRARVAGFGVRQDDWLVPFGMDGMSRLGEGETAEFRGPAKLRLRDAEQSLVIWVGEHVEVTGPCIHEPLRVVPAELVEREAYHMVKAGTRRWMKLAAYAGFPALLLFDAFVAEPLGLVIDLPGPTILARDKELMSDAELKERAFAMLWIFLASLLGVAMAHRGLIRLRWRMARKAVGRIGDRAGEGGG